MLGEGGRTKDVRTYMSILRSGTNTHKKKKKDKAMIGECGLMFARGAPSARGR